MRLLTLFITLLAISSTTAFAHENQLSGLLYMQPQTPQPDEPFTITFELYDPEGKFIPSAILNLAIPNLELEKSFIETSQTGIYQMELSLPKGRWFADVTEATFEGESNTVQLGLKVGEKNREILEILFPVIEEDVSPRNWMVFLCCIAVIGLSVVLTYVYKFNIYTFRTNETSKISTNSVVNQQ